ncbi:PucR family transcriptional regulator [Nocardioides sp. GY 10127]|nr:PucR family transcriptional regulator [Nocardioides sp. GY 10127]
MPLVREADPEVVAGASALDRPIRWVHATELSDIAPLLRPGDLLLTTGVGLEGADDPVALAAFAASLAESECAGLVVELGRRWRDALPAALVQACAATDLPLVALHHELRFAALTQAVGERIVDAQLAELRESERVHDTFTELGFNGAGPEEVLEAVQRLAGSPVVLEDGDHRVLDYRVGGGDPGEFLRDWSTRSTRVRPGARTGWDERNGWLVTRLGRRDQDWGRLVIGADAPPTARLVAVAERAAAALAMHRLHDRDRGHLLRRTHADLLAALLREPGSTDVRRRLDLAGFPTRRRVFVGLSVRVPGRDRTAPELLTTVLHAADSSGLPALVVEESREVVVLLSLPTPAAGTPGAHPAEDRLAARVRERWAGTPGRTRLLVAAGRAVGLLEDVDRTLREAGQVADAVSSAGAGRSRTVHRLEDVHLRGLLALLGDDDRLRLFAERELTPLRRHDAEHGTDLVAAVRALLEHPTSKSDAAAALHLSRAAFYARLERAERVLGARLDDPEVRVSLHVALLAEQVRDSGS